MKTVELTEQALAVLPCLHEGPDYRLYLQLESAYLRPVVIKVSRSDAATPQSTDRLANEYRLTANLELPGIRRAYEQLSIAGCPALALEYFEGHTLCDAYVNQRRSIADNLAIAVTIANLLEGLHRQNLVHRNLASSHILVSPASPAVMLIGFGSASPTDGKGVHPEMAESSLGTFAYVSPEQTGRTARMVDRRSDLYSLGAVLYEVFTGSLPFDSDDPAELIHCHLAQMPVPPCELISDVPGAVSDIVMRLMAKNPDERYQSALGAKIDLENCLSQLRQTGRIGELKLGEADYSGALRLPDKLYGREREIELLQDAINATGKGAARVVLISGMAGVGKTVLVEELHRYASGQGIGYVEGRYQSSQRHLPYSGLIQAFDEFIDLILMDSAEQLAQWRARILEAVGGNGSLLLAMIPRLELVIGPQAATPELGPTESQHRFQHLLLSFILSLARRERPLLLFLDNLQWADQASLHLLNLLLPALDTQPIAFLAAYRTDEVGPGHPLAVLRDNLQPLGTLVRTIKLENLSLAALNRLIADALKAEASFTLPLALLVQEKTANNALFAVQFLQSITEKGLLKFNADNCRWIWDTEGIRELEIAGGAATLMTKKLNKLPEAAQSLLSLAACIGNRFDPHLLAELMELPVVEIADILLAVVEAGLILPLVGNRPMAAAEKVSVETSFEFSDDRLRQAAYALLPQKQRRMTHAKIGRLLLAQTPENVLEDNIFAIADQLNEGFQYLKDDQERQQLLVLNLMAGRKAKRAAAYQAAIRYLSMGIGLLPANRWACGGELTLNLFMEAIEAEYLSSNFERAALLSTEVLEHVQDLFSRVRVHELRILFFTAQDQNAFAVQAGLEALGELDMPLPLESGAAEALQKQLAEAISRVEGLAHLPKMTDRRHLAVMRVLMHLTASAQRTDLELWRTIIASMVLLSVKHGNSPMAAFAYGWHGAFLCGNVDGIAMGYRFGRLSLEVIRQFSVPEFQTKVEFVFNAYVRHWKESARESTEPLEDVYRRGVETGDLEYLGYGAIHHCGYLFCTGAPLALIHRQQMAYLEIMERSRLPFPSQLIRIWGQLVINLSGGTGDASMLKGELFDESKWLPDWIEKHDALLAFGTICSRMMLQYLFGDYAGAVASGRQAEPYAQSVRGLLYQANHCFYYALALLARHELADAAERNECLRLAEPFLEQFKGWAESAPMNFAQKLALLEAEQARISGANGRAMECFNDAIRLARENAYLQDEALAYEREAAFYKGLGRDDIAGVCLRKAVEAFKSWGALRKAQELELRFQPLVAARPTLDTTAVVKASHTLSQEIHLEKLLEKLMNIVIENAGAEKGILIQKTDTGLVIQAMSNIDGCRVETQQGAAVDTSGELAVSVVNYVARTQNQVVLGDAFRDLTFGSDPYIAERRIRSLLCLPILYQGKLSGLLYLENNLANDVFTEDRLELLKALASQAAISMENAGLYAELENNIVALKQAEGELRKYRDYLEEQVQARTAELTDANSRLIQEIAERQKVQEVLNRRLVALTEPMETADITFSDLFNIDEIQKIQDAFAAATNVASVITHPDGTPITTPSNFCRLCRDIIRKTEKGLANCYCSDAMIGRENPGGPIVQPCLSGGLWDAGASITVGGMHIANWLIGQVKNEAIDEEKILHYAREIGANEEEFRVALREVPVMSSEQFGKIADTLFLMANELSVKAYQNVQQARFITLRQRAENELQRARDELELRVSERTAQLSAANELLLGEIEERKRAESELRRYKGQLEETVRQRTAELLLARDAAEASNKAKSVFLANMSHELRTPLNAILGFSSIMRRDPLITESQRENLDIINRSGEHLLTLINDVLEIAKIEAGKLQLEIAPFDLGAMVREVTDMMQVRARGKGLQLLLDQASEFPRYIQGDEARLRQILVNLVGNAVKFTEQGGVTIRLGSLQNDREHLMIEIEDTGPGISTENLKRLFKPFVQLAEGAEQKGTGLGLTITRQFVEMMGGRISVESTVGKGSLFRVELPVELADVFETPKPKAKTRREIAGLAPGQPRYRILIAEDQHENQLLLTRLMNDIGLEVMLAENGEKCVRLFQDWHPDLIWMDRRMPVMDGEEATRRIRRLPEGDKVKIVAVTASAFKEEQQEILAAGMDDFVRKPYRFEELYECLARQLGVKYLYHGEEGTDAAGPRETLDAAMLSGLSANQRQAFREALVSLDSESISMIIKDIREFDSNLGQALTPLAECFDYPAILRLLDEADAMRDE